MQEAKQQEREERQRAAGERRAKLAADAKQRAAKSKLLYKKTAHGQPVMKYRVEKMLAQLQQGA
jgi:apyrase